MNASSTVVHDHLPLYLRIREQIIEMIVADKLKGGDSLPSEVQLAKRFGVALGTLRKAVDDLVARNIVERVHGKGLFVSVYDTESAMRLFHVVSDSMPKELRVSTGC